MHGGWGSTWAGNTAPLPPPKSAGREHAHRAQCAAVLGYASAYARRGEYSNGDFHRQAEEISGECERRGLSLLDIVREREPEHQSALERPGLGYALRRIAEGEASGLVVSELSRLTHSVPDLGRVLEWFSRHDARFVVGAPGLDSDEDAGRLALQTIIEISGWERRRLIERTRNGMRAARRKGPASVADNPELSKRIAELRGKGMTLQAIADQLNIEQIPTVRGGAEWRPSSVQAAVGYHRPPANRTLDLRSREVNYQIAARGGV